MPSLLWLMSLCSLPGSVEEPRGAEAEVGEEPEERDQEPVRGALPGLLGSWAQPLGPAWGTVDKAD